MATKPKQQSKGLRLYWDTCVLVSYIEEHPGRIADIEAFLADAKAGKVEILTSVATIAEVAFAESERIKRVLDPNAEQRIESLWTPPSPIKLVELHQLIAREARGLVRLSMANGWGLKPYDALHLSTAKYVAVDRFDTYDEKLPKYAPYIGCDVGPPLVSQTTIYHAEEVGMHSTAPGDDGLSPGAG